MKNYLFYIHANLLICINNLFINLLINYIFSCAFEDKTLSRKIQVKKCVFKEKSIKNIICYYHCILCVG